MSSSALLPQELQLVAIGILLLFAGRVLYLIRYRQLSLRDSLLWLLSTTAGLLVTIFPGALRRIADLLAISVASNALFALAIMYLAINLLSLTIATSNGASRLRRVTQECAILRAQIEDLRSMSVRGGDSSMTEPIPPARSPTGSNAGIQDT